MPSVHRQGAGNLRNHRPTFAHRLQYGLFLALQALVGIVPWWLARALGRAVGRLYYRIDARHRRVVRENLRNASLGINDRAIRAMSRACFEHFGTLLFTILRSFRASPEAIRRITRIQGREYIEAALAEGKGVIGLTAHLGNWELMGLALGLEGLNLTVIGRELDNPLLETRLRQFRMKSGNSFIAKEGAVRGTLKALKKGKVVAFLLDQDALTTGVFVAFMGRWASTFSTPAMLACRYDLPILPVASRVEVDGTITVRAFPSFHPSDTGDSARDVWTTTQLMTSWIEARVREQPCQWFWMHRRFKTQPGPGMPGPPPEWLTGNDRPACG